MSDRSKIEWTEATWNPVRGCTQVSAGCSNCYAKRFAERFRGVKGSPYEQGFDLRTVPKLLELPLHWREPRFVFTNSMSDLFHKRVPVAYVREVFDVMQRAPQHTFQVLTKRAERLARLAPSLPWPPNVWMGVTVEAQDYVGRVDLLRQTAAAVKFVSVEPMLGPVVLNLKGIHWVIVGGESGPGARPMAKDWVRAVRKQCQTARVPFFFKQWGGVQKNKRGRILDRRTWDERPAPDAGEHEPRRQELSGLRR
jgi:protein gp37